MPTYRFKEGVFQGGTIEAFQMLPEMRTDPPGWPSWFSEALEEGEVRFDFSLDQKRFVLHRRLLPMRKEIINWRDYVIQTFSGDIYALQESEFLQTYELAEESSQEDKGRKKEDVKPSSTNPPDHIMQFFAYQHLPEHLQEISRPFGKVADWVVANIPRNPERTVALRKLLEGKDAAVRAFLAKDHEE